MAVKPKKVSKGMLLEQMLNKVNESYEEKGMATFKKIPNNWKVTRKGPHITGASPIPSGLCDYVGTSHYVNGKTVVFDAKECELKKQFNLRYIKWEQMEHMKEVEAHGGISFVLVWFTELDEYYCLPYSFILPYWEASETEEGVQHITLKDIQEHAYKLDSAAYFEYVVKENAERNKRG